MSPPTLTTIPPELLLTIISHLPSSTSLYTLSQTSRFLSSFLHTHSATICNTHIQQHYTHAASILKSDYVDGWLVPKHHCILEAEERWLMEQPSRTPSLVSQPRALNVNNCCFRTESSISSGDTPARPRTIPLHQTSEPISPLSTTHRPLLPLHITHHQDLSLSLTLGLPLKLSRPGPHYLSFLERYSGEIVARWVMDSSLRDIPEETSEQISGIVETRLGGSGHFDFMVGNYCVRKWLVMCQDAFGDGLFCSGDVVKTSRVDVWKERICSIRDCVKEGIKTLRGRVARKKKTLPARMLFGEIDSEDEKGGLVVEKDNWVKGLLWYYGISGQLAASSEPAAERWAPGKVQKMRNCATVFAEKLRQRTKKLGPKVKNAWRTLRCEGRFQLLEG